MLGPASPRASLWRPRQTLAWQLTLGVMKLSPHIGCFLCLAQLHTCIGSSSSGGARHTIGTPRKASWPTVAENIPIYEQNSQQWVVQGVPCPNMCIQTHSNKSNSASTRVCLLLKKGWKCTRRLGL